MDEVTRITSPILITGKNRGKQIDYRYGPYNGLAIAYETLGPDGLDCICDGLTIGIKLGNKIEEYWFVDGVLQKKIQEQENLLTWN